MLLYELLQLSTLKHHVTDIIITHSFKENYVICISKTVIK